ncbi:MAG: hypothetical protein ACI9RO_000266 [Alteromonas macleodii]|jgi:hypothetical protein
MTMTTDEKMLEAALTLARTPDVVPSDALMNRIMLDADKVLAGSAPVITHYKHSLGAMLLDVIGGRPTFSGLAAAAVAGFWIGVAPPAFLSDLSVGIWGGTIEILLFESDIYAELEG